MCDKGGGTGRWAWLRLGLLAVVLLLWLLLPGRGGRAQPAAPAGVAPMWQVQCVVCEHAFDHFSPRAAAVDAVGRVHVAYGGRHLYYALQEGDGPWQVMVVDEADNSGSAATLALDGAGRPRILYWDGGNLSLRYAWFDGVSWQREMVPFAPSLTEAPEAQMALDGAGQAHVVFVTGSTLYYGVRAPGGWQWQLLGGNAGARASVAVDGAGQPHIAYQGAGKLAYTTFDGVTWLTHTFADPPSAGAYPGIAVDDAGNVHIVAGGTDYGPDEIAGLFYFNENGGGWQLEVVAEIPEGGWFWSSHAWSNSLQLDSNGAPHVSFSSTYDCGTPYCTPWQIVNLARRTATGWEMEPVTPEVLISLDGVERSSLTLMPDDEPRVMYVAYGALHGAQPGGTPWPATVVDRSRDSGASSRLELDGAGRMHVAYTDSESLGLWHASMEDGQWVSQRINYGYTGSHYAFAVGGEGTGHALWASEWRFGSDLRHAQGDSSGWTTDSVPVNSYVVGLDTFDVTADAAGLAYVSYTAGDPYTVGFVRQSATGWETPEVVDDPAAYGQTLIALDGLAQPHVVYARGGQAYGPADELVDAAGAGGGWTATTIEETPGAHYRLEEFVRDRRGRLHLLYVVEETFSGGNLLRYARLDESGWHVETLIGNVGDASLGVDTAGGLHLVYYQEDMLHYVNNGGTGWVERLQVYASALGNESDVAAANLLTPRITFYDPALGALKILYHEPSDFVFLPRAGR